MKKYNSGMVQKRYKLALSKKTFKRKIIVRLISKAIFIVFWHMVLFSFLEVRERGPSRSDKCPKSNWDVPNQYWDSQSDLFVGKSGRLLTLNFLYYLYGLEVSAFIVSWAPNPRKYQQLTCCQKFQRTMIVFFFVGFTFALQWTSWYIVYDRGQPRSFKFHISVYFVSQTIIPIQYFCVPLWFMKLMKMDCDYDAQNPVDVLGLAAKDGKADGEVYQKLTIFQQSILKKYD